MIHKGPKWKYNLNHQLSILPKMISIPDAEEYLEKEYGISRDTFYHDRMIELKNVEFIPSNRIDIYCTVFNCSYDQLKNYKLKLGKSLREVFAESSEQKEFNCGDGPLFGGAAGTSVTIKADPFRDDPDGEQLSSSGLLVQYTSDSSST